MPEKNTISQTGEALDDLLQDIEESLRKAKILRSEVEGIRRDFHSMLKKRQAGSIEEDGQEESDVLHKEELDEMEEPAFSFYAGSLEDRIKDHEEWVEAVRDPAYENSEGLRILRAGNGKATAEYEIAQLPNDRWAIRISLSYHSGNMEGVTNPWSDQDSRKDCLDQFESQTKEFFQKPIDSGGNDLQRHARTEMLKHFSNSLFGFIEPEPKK